MDGHASHMTSKFLRHCINNNIICLCLPAHSSHLLQPLDVTLFSVLAHAYCVELDKLQRKGRAVVNKGEFWRMLKIARAITYTEKLIRKSFEATGINPFNPRLIVPPHSTSTQSPTITRPCAGSLQTLTPYKSPARTPRGVIHMVRQLKTLITKDTPNAEQLREGIDALGMITEGALADIQLRDEVIADLRAPLAGAGKGSTKDQRHRSKAQIIDAAEVLRLEAEENRKQAEQEAKREARVLKAAIKAGKAVAPITPSKPPKKHVTIQDSPSVYYLEGLSSEGEENSCISSESECGSEEEEVFITPVIEFLGALDLGAAAGEVEEVEEVVEQPPQRTRLGRAVIKPEKFA